MKRNRGCQSDFIIEDEELDVFPELRFEITDFNPGRPAPVCSNPSSPAFSDPGDPMEYNIDRVILTVNGREIEITGEIKDAIIEAVDCRLENKVENIGEMAIEDRLLDIAIENHEAKMEEKFHRKGA